jgi:hypothetical protein
MALVAYSDVKSLSDLNSFGASLLVAGIVGAITGGILAVDKAVRALNTEE